MNEDYTVDLRANTKNYQQEIGQSVTVTDQLISSLSKVGESLGNLYRRADRGLKIVAAGEAAAITAVTVAAARLNQQQSQLQARQVMLDKSSKGYITSVTKMRTEFGMASKDAIGLITQLNKLGASEDSVKNMAQQYVKLSAVTGESINGLAAANQQYMRTMQAAPSQTEKYSSMLATVSENMGTSAQSTVDFANSIAPLSKTLGMSAQQITGISGAFSKAGADGGAAANVYTKILSDVNDAIQTGSPQISVYSNLLGKTVEEFKGMPKADIVTEIFNELNKQGPNAIKTLNALGLEGVRSQRAIAAVVQSGGLGGGIALAEQGFGNSDKFNKASEQALAGMNDSLAKISETTKSFAQSIGGIFLPAADKMASGLNDILGPVRAFTDFLNSLGQGTKLILGLAAALTTLGPLIPKAFLALAGAGWMSAALRGPASAGFTLGRNPNRELNERQRNYVDGGGNAAQRTLFRGGLMLGDRLNPTGRRGSLSSIDFTNPEGERAPIRSGHEWTREAMDRFGIQVPQRIQDARKAGRETSRELREELGSGHRANIIGGMAFGGQLVRSTLANWQPAYLQNSMGTNRDALTQQPRWRDTALGQGVSRIGGAFTKAGFDDNVSQMRQSLQDANRELKNLPKINRELGSNVKKSSTIMGQFARDTGRFMVTGGLAMAGAAGGGVALAGQGVKAAGGLVGRGAGALIGAAGGPAGIALMGGLAAGGATLASYAAERAQFKAGVKGNEDDSSAGGTYRAELGIATAATRSFAEVLNESAGRISARSATYAESLKISSIDVVDARKTQLQDKRFESMDVGEATTYAGGVLRSGDTRTNQALKLDLINRYGERDAEKILAGGQQQTDMSNLFSLANEENQDKIFGHGFENDWILKHVFKGGMRNMVSMSDTNKEAVNTIGDTGKMAIGQAYQREGAEGEGKQTQALINSFFTNVQESARKTPGRRDQLFDPVSGMGQGSQATKAQLQGLMQSLQISPEDTASQRGFQNALAEVKKLDPGLSKEDNEKALQDIITRSFEGTTAGQKIAVARQSGGIYSGTGYGSADPSQGDPLSVYGNMREVMTKTAVGRMALRMPGEEPGLAGIAPTLTKAVDQPQNMNLQRLAVNDMVAGARSEAGGDMTTAIDNMQRFSNSVGDSITGLKELTAAAIETARKQRDFTDKMGGRSNLIDRTKTAGRDYRAAEEQARANPEAEGVQERLQATREGLQAVQNEQYDRLKGLATQYRNFDIQRAQGEAQMSRSIARTKRDNALSERYGQEDYNISRGRSRTQFNLSNTRARTQFDIGRERSDDQFELSRTRARADFGRSQSRARFDFNLSQTHSISDFNLSRKRSEDEFQLSRQRGEVDYQRSRKHSEEDFALSRARMHRDFEKSQDRARADYNRSRARDEEDHNLQLVRMAEDSASRIYDIYSRITVERTWDAANLLQNMEDQQKRLDEQQANLGKARKMGLSDKTINQLGLTDASKAQQLERLVQDLESDPDLIAAYNKAAQRRQSSAGDLAKEDPAYKRSEADRKKQLKRQAEDFERGVKQGREDYNQALSDMQKDFRRNAARQEKEYRLSLSRSAEDFQRITRQQSADFNKQLKRSRDAFARSVEQQRSDFWRGMREGAQDYRRASRQQLEDFNRQMKDSRTDFNTQMNQAAADFQRLRERRRKAMSQGFADMRKDFDYQMDLEEKNIALFGAEIDATFDDLQRTVGDRTSGLLKTQIQTMQTLTKEYKTAILAVDTEVSGVFKKYDLYDVLGGGRKGENGGPGDSKPNNGGQKGENGGTGGSKSAADETLAANLGNEHTHTEACGHGGAATASGGGGLPPQGGQAIITGVGGPKGDSGSNNATKSDGGGFTKHNPLRRMSVSTPYGKKGPHWASGYHTGVDLRGSTGTPIYSVGPGVVKASTGSGGAYGQFTKIAHGGGLESWYAHQSKRLVKKGDTVRGGEHIGNIGNTGNSFGSHLHLEIHTNGGRSDRVNPMTWLRNGKRAGGGELPNVGGSPGGGGGGGMSAPSVDFAKMKSLQRLEGMIGRNFGKYGLKSGMLSGLIQTNFDKKWAEANPFNDWGSSDGGSWGDDPDSGGSTGPRGVWNALRSGGLTAKQAAGVMGNIEHESRFIWNIVQGGRRSSNPRVRVGYGLVQWTPGTKLAKMLGGRKNNLENQIEVLFEQLRGKHGMYAEGGAGKRLRAADSVFEASKAFHLGYERPKDQSNAAVRRRAAAGARWYKRYGGVSVPGGGDDDGGGGGGGGGRPPARGRYSLGKVWNRVRDAANRAGPAYGIKTIYGYARKPGYHGKGLALDFMINNLRNGKSVGNRLENHLFANRRAYGINELIWDRHIRTAARGWRNRGYSGPSNHTDHVHASFGHLPGAPRSGYRMGTNSANTGWHLVGEDSPEWVYFKGGEKVRNGAQTAVINSKAGATVHAQASAAQTVNHSYDHSNQFSGPITVQAQDPNQMARELETKARLKSLTSPARSK